MSETTSRVLQLLGLLQSRRVWSGEELAERLGVTTRSVRRDVDRLRDLGYPVHASTGHGGGYQLGRARRCRRCCSTPRRPSRWPSVCGVAAGGSVAGRRGVGAARAVQARPGDAGAAALPGRRRARRDRDADVRPADTPVEPDVLMTLARACRDHEHVTAGYVDIRGNATAAPARALPARHHRPALVPAVLTTATATTGAACGWTGWPTSRALGSTFTPRDAPDAAAYVRRAITSSPYRYVARVRYFAPQDVVAQIFSAASVEIEPDGPDACIVTAGADDPERMVPCWPCRACDFEVLEPPEVVDAVRDGRRTAGPRGPAGCAARAAPSAATQPRCASSQRRREPDACALVSKAVPRICHAAVGPHVGVAKCTLTSARVDGAVHRPADAPLQVVRVALPTAVSAPDAGRRVEGPGGCRPVGDAVGIARRTHASSVAGRR